MEIKDRTRLEIKGKGEQVKNMAADLIIRDSISVCFFGRPALDPRTLVDIVSSLLGLTWSIDDFKEVGMRVMCQERLFNMREAAITPKDDSLPPRLLNEPKPDGPTAGVVVTLEELKEDYYRAVGWDLLTGNPKVSLLKKLEIEE